MKNILFIIIGTLCFSSSCKDDLEPIEELNTQKKIVLPEGGKQLTTASNEFSIDLFKKIYNNTTEDENIFISPLSASMALSMTCNGAQNSTLDSMMTALKYNHLSLNQVNAINKTLIHELPTVDPQTELSIANSIWYRQDFNVLNEFINNNSTHYNAEITQLDFSNPNSVNTINDWVKNKTNNKIPKLIDQINAAHVMYLINAIYFKGDWSIQLKEENTHSGSFTKSDESNTIVEMMHISDTFNYYSDKSIQALELNYGRRNFSMLILLPNQNTSLSDFTQNINTTDIDNYLSQMTLQKVSVSLPKFKFDYKIKLNDVLSTMGMGIAFSDQADFSNINGTGGLCIDYVLQKAFVDVNEKGTEAAAATVVSIRLTSIMEEVFNANRPFLFMIREKSTNTILFIGSIQEPIYTKQN